MKNFAKTFGSNTAVTIALAAVTFDIIEKILTQPLGSSELTALNITILCLSVGLFFFGRKAMRDTLVAEANEVGMKAIAAAFQNEESDEA